MKKILTSTIAFVLALVSLVIPSETIHPTIWAGVGNGQNAEVSGPQEFAEIMEYASRLELLNDTASSGSPSVIAASAGSAKEEKFEGTPVSSLTFHVDSTTNYFKSLKEAVYNQYNPFEEPTYNKIGTNSANRIWRYSVYMTTDSIYMVSYSAASSDVTYYNNSEKNQSLSGVKDVEIYGDGEQFLIKFHSFYQTDFDYVFKDEVWGKWIQFPAQDAYSLFYSLYSPIQAWLEQGATIFSEFENIDIQKEAEEGGYTLNQQGERYEVINEEESQSMILDFSDPQSPTFSLKEDKKDEEDIDYLSGTLTFCNMNNTVINTNFKDVISFDDYDEFEKKYTRKIKEDD